MELSIPAVQYGFNNSLSEPEELYRNTLVSVSKLMNSSEFENFKFSFKTEPHEHGEALDLNFTKADFIEI